MPRSFWVVTLILAGLLSGCSGSRSPTAGSAPSPDRRQPVASTTPQKPSDSLPVGPGGPASERFCAARPATGTVDFIVRGGTAHLLVRLRHVASHSLLGISWSSGPEHEGEVIASVRFNHDGRSEQRSLRFFHEPFYRRRGTSIDIITNSERTVVDLHPC